MKNKIYLTTCLILIVAFSNAQTSNKCGTMEHHTWKMQTDSKYAESFKLSENLINKFIEKNNNHNSNRISNQTSPDTIPIVVHVVWKTSGQNITDQQVISQIDALNEDFSRTNADSINTPAVWRPIAGRMPYHFILARRDPNGNPTNGIVRVQTSSNSFSTNDAIKFNSQGGSDAWDVDTYLNIWVGNLSGGVLGYGEFPTTVSSNTYGFVCQYDAFGRVGNVNPPYDLGRTTTHEISHCFNLFHIWGDDGGACNGSDQVSDTPNQSDATFGCLAFPAVDACSVTSPGIMFMNYMDYSDDNCLNMFTNGQTTRMVAAVTNFYPSIVNSIGIQPVSLLAIDAGINSIVSPSNNYCTDSIQPMIILKNWGSSNLTSATINFKLDNNAVQTFSWTGALGSLDTITVLLPIIVSSPGSHTFISYTTIPNGIADMNNLNDTSSSTFNIISIGQNLPYTQNFSNITFPPSGWSLTNPDGATTWARSSVSQDANPGSLWMDNYNYNASGEIDELETEAYDLTSIANPRFSFYLAYKLYTDPALNPNYSDTLEVLISTDCGQTFTSIYKKFGIPLTTTTPTWANNQFVPTAAQWRQEIIDLLPFAAIQNAVFKFRNITQYENHLYIDNINIDFITSVEAINKQFTPQIYPNPTSGKINILFSEPVNELYKIEIYNSIGQNVFTKKNVADFEKTQIDLNGIADGVYTINIISGKYSYKGKLIIQN